MFSRSFAFTPAALRVLFGRFALRLVLFALIGAPALAPGSASATGFTRAEADGSLQTGAIAGTVAWSGCVAPQCSWTPFVSVQPDSPDYACRGDEYVDADPDTTVIFNGGRQTSGLTLTFDVHGVPLAGRRRVCISVYEARLQPDPACIQAAPVTGIDPGRCQLVVDYSGHALRETILPGPADPSATPDPAETPPPAPAPTPRSRVRPVRTRCGTVRGPVVVDHIEARRVGCATARRLGRRWRSRLRRSRCGTIRRCRVGRFTCRARLTVGRRYPVRCRRGERLVVWRIAFA